MIQVLKIIVRQWTTIMAWRTTNDKWEDNMQNNNDEDNYVDGNNNTDNDQRQGIWK